MVRIAAYASRPRTPIFLVSLHPLHLIKAIHRDNACFSAGVLPILDVEVVKMEMEIKMDIEMDVRISMSLGSRRLDDEVVGGDCSGASK